MRTSSTGGSPPMISVIIPSYNGRHLLEECLPALFAALNRSSETGAEVIVADDASTDDTLEWLRTEWPEVRVVSLLSNSGFTRATNAGILASRGEWLGLLNNDTRVGKDWLRSALPRMEEGVGSIATQILFMQDSQTIDSAGDSYTVIGTALKREHRNVYEKGCAPALPLFSACAASAFFRREALVAVGLFDEYMGAYYDDIDVGFRLQLAGFACVYSPESICFHRGNASYEEGSFRVWYQTSRNSEIVFWSDMPGPLLIRYGAPHLFFSLLQIFTMLISGGFTANLLGKMSVFGAIPYILSKRRRVNELRKRSLGELRAKMAPKWFRLHARQGLIRPRRYP